jgi:hypothetical protein
MKKVLIILLVSISLIPTVSCSSKNSSRNIRSTFKVDKMIKTDGKLNGNWWQTLTEKEKFCYACGFFECTSSSNCNCEVVCDSLEHFKICVNSAIIKSMAPKYMRSYINKFYNDHFQYKIIPIKEVYGFALELANKNKTKEEIDTCVQLKLKYYIDNPPTLGDEL